MANEFIRAETVIRTALGMLEREIVLPRLVWRDAVPSFRGAKDDTVSIRVPAFTTARTRVLRGGRPITVDNLAETKVDITLDTDVYKAVAVTDEEMTLDIADFGAQVLQPVVAAVARGVEDSLSDTMNAASYETEITLNEDDPYVSLIDARTALNKANVPMGGRFLAVGADVEAAILKSDRLSKFDQSGSDDALREASIGRIAGFTAVSAPGLDPDVAIAAHQTAFALATVAPVVPDGAPWGRSESFAGLTMRVLRDYDFLNVQDRLLADLFVGSASVSDRGTLEDGVFTPSADGDDDPVLVRAVRIAFLGGS
jgi:hypothetical protein